MCCSQICPIYFSSSSFCNILWQQAQDVRYYGKTPSCSSSSFTECFLRIDCSYVIASDEQQFLFKFIPHLHYFANFVSILIQSFPIQCQQLFSPSLCSSCSIPLITLIVLCIFSSDHYLFLERQRPKVLKVQVHQGLCTYKLLWSSVEPLTSQMVKKKKKQVLSSVSNKHTVDSSSLCKLPFCQSMLMLFWSFLPHTWHLTTWKNSTDIRLPIYKH